MDIFEKHRERDVVDNTIDLVRDDLGYVYGPHPELGGIAVFRKWIERYEQIMALMGNRQFVLDDYIVHHLKLSNFLIPGSTVFKKYIYRQRDGCWLVIKPSEPL